MVDCASPLQLTRVAAAAGFQVANIPASFVSVANMADSFYAIIMEEYRAGLAQDMVVKPGEPTPEGPIAIVSVPGESSVCDHVYKTRAKQCVHVRRS